MQLYGPHGGGRWFLCVVVFALSIGLAGHGRLNADSGAALLIMVNEFYSNADGTKQFVELIALSEGQTNTGPTHVESMNADGSDTTVVYDFTGSFSQLGNNETILLATAGAVAELGFNADRVIPDNSLSLVNGKVVYDNDGLGGTIDEVAYGAYTGTHTGYGTPALQLPTNGIQSLTRIRYSFVTPNNSTDFVYAINSPKRNDGATGSLQGDPYAPVLAPIGSQGVEEGQHLNFAVSATDQNGTIPTLAAVGLPMGSSFNDQGNGNGVFNWTPTYLQSVIDTVLIVASDGSLADSEHVEITVVEVTNPPFAYDSASTSSEDTPVEAQLQASDPDNDTLIFIIQSGPFRGQVSDLDTLTGTFTYSPNLNLNGPDSLTFRVYDRNAYSNSAKWRVTVSPVNDAPVAADVIANTVKNYSTSVGSMPVTDIDNVSLTIAQLAGPFNGSVSNFNSTTGSFDYDPDLDYVGDDSITYRASDGIDTSEHKLIRITIYPECGCPCPADPVCDSVRSNIQDVVAVVNVAFRGLAPTTDPSCIRERTDVNCNGSTEVLDVVKVVNVAFRGFAAATEFCNPCAP